MLNEIYLNDKKTYKELINKINVGVLKNYKEVSENWKRYKNPLEKYFKKSYDIYLKANNQTKGIKTYNLVVDLLVNEYVPIFKYSIVTFSLSLILMTLIMTIFFKFFMTARSIPLASIPG